MYELNGKQMTLEQVQAAADSYQLSLEEFINKFGVKSLDDALSNNKHISRNMFDDIMGQEGNKVEDNLETEFNNHYGSNSGYKFEQYGPFMDGLRVTNSQGQVQNFKLPTIYNKGKTTPDDVVEMLGLSSYDDIINFLDSDQSSEKSKTIFNKTSGNITPETYPVINTGFESMAVPGTVPGSSFNVNRQTTRIATEDEAYNIVNLTEKYLKEFVKNPYSDENAHPYDTQGSFTDKWKEGTSRAVYERVKSETGLDISYDSFIEISGGKNFQSGMILRLKNDLSAEENKINYLNAAKTEDIDMSNDPLVKSFENQQIKGQRFNQGTARARIELIDKLNKNTSLIRRLNNNIVIGEGDETQQRSEIKKLQDENEKTKQELKKLATFKKGKSYSPYSAYNVGGSYTEYEYEDKELSSNFYNDQGYTKASAEKIAQSAQNQNNNIESTIADLKSSNFGMNDYEAHGLHYKNLFKVYRELLSVGEDKNINVDLSILLQGKEMPTNAPGITRNFVAPKITNMYNTLKNEGYINEYGIGQVPYNFLHKNGYTSRHFDGFFDMLEGAIKEEDVKWMSVHEEALDDNLGSRSAMFKLNKLAIDPGEMEKGGFWTSMVNSGTKQFMTEWGGLSEAEADRTLASASGKTMTTRYMLDELAELEVDYNSVNQEKIEKGDIRSFEYTDDQAEIIERTLREEVGEGVGHFMPTLVKLGVISAATGGTGIPALIGTRLRTAKNVYERLKYHAAGMMLEEGKMLVAGFKPTSGAAFYAGGAATSFIKIPAGNAFSFLNPLFQKVVKGGPVGAASMEFASITELAYDELMNNRDFRSEFNEMFGSYDDVEKRLLTNSIVFGVVGAQHLKRTDFMHTSAKVKLRDKLRNELNSIEGKEKIDVEAIIDNAMISGKSLPEAMKEISKAYEKSLSPKDLKKVKTLQSTIDNLNHMIRIEQKSIELDPFGGKGKEGYEKLDIKEKKAIDKKFEDAFNNQFTRPIQEAIRTAVPEFKGFKVEFVDGKIGENGLAEYQPGGGKKEGRVLISKEAYKDGAMGKEIHEMAGHAAMRAVFDARPDLQMKFTENLFEKFKEYDKIFDSVGGPGSLQKFIKTEYKGDSRTSEIKNLRQEELISYMLEAFTNPEIYYSTVGSSFAKDVKQEFTSLLESNFGYRPKIKNAGDFVGFLSRLSRDIKRGRNIDSKIKTMTELNNIDFLGIELTSNKGKEIKKLQSKDLVNNNRNLSEQLIKSRLEGKDAITRNIEGKLLQNNEPLINKFVNEYFKPEKGGTKEDFMAETMFEVIKLTQSYLKGAKSVEGKAEFGAYLSDALFGYNPITKKGGSMGPIGRQGNILQRFEKTKRPMEFVSIDGEQSFLQLEGGIQSGGSVGSRQAEAGLINLKNKLKLTDNHISSIESKIDVKNIDKLNYRDLQDLTPNITMEMFGGRSDVKVGESSKNIKQKAEYIAKNWKTLYELLPHGAMLKTGVTSIEGLSTQIRDPLLNNLLYKPVSRVGKKAQASAAETGKTSGLPVQNKIKNLTQAQFLEKFGIIVDANGKIDLKKTKIKAQSRELRAVDALIAETGRAITNQVVRNYLETKGGYEANPQLAQTMAKDALLNQIKGGKSESLQSKEFYNSVEKEFGNMSPQLINQFFRNRKQLLASNPKAYGIIKDAVELVGRAHAESGKAAEYFMTSMKKSKYNEIVTLKEDGAMFKLSDAKFKESDQAQKLFQDMAFDLAAFVPKIDIVNQSGNQKMILDLFAGHYNIVGSANAKVESNFKKVIREKLAKDISDITTGKKPKDFKIELESDKKTGIEKLEARIQENKDMGPGNAIMRQRIKEEIQSQIEKVRELEIQNTAAEIRSKLEKATGKEKENLELALQEKFKDFEKEVDLAGLDIKTGELIKEIIEPSKELLEKWAKIDWNELKSSYASSYYTGYKAIMNATNFKQQVKLAKQYFSAKDGKMQRNLYDAWNSTLQEWLYSSKEGSKEFNNKADYILKIKKANGNIGTTGERVLAPPGYIYLPGKIFDGKIKFEHLKSSNQQSIESTMLVLGGKWTSQGKKTLSKYKGIYGLLSDFNLIDDLGRINSADIFRFAENLKLAKNIYRIDGQFKTTLYSDMIKTVGRSEVKKLEELPKLQSKDMAINMGRRIKPKRKGISIFDFDQTLANTKEKIKVTMPDGKTERIGAAEFARQAESLEAKGAKFDFTEFNNVINAEKGPLADLALKRQNKFGSGDIFILTARPQTSALAIQKFLKGVGLDIKLENIKGLESGLPQAKADFVIEKAGEGYNDFYFADDMIKNVKAVKTALTQLDVKSDVQQALQSRDLNLDFNKILENKSGISAEKIYSKAKAQVAGANKGRFKFFIPPSAEDFVGLIYPTLGKGKKGDAQMAWYKKNLLDPFARAENSITKERHQMMKDFQSLKQEIKDVPKDLRKIIEKGPAKGYTKEQAMRVYIWNKQGMEIPGLGKTDLRQLNGYVKKNKSLMEFADKLIMIHKGDGYAKPGQNWLAGTVTTDMFEALSGTKRVKHLKEWQTNADVIFSEKNLNKLEAIYGSKYREALVNMLGRMKSGQNRKQLGGAFQRLENEVLDWTNNSVGAIMFLNSRSAVLQTISAINYINFRDNNPLAAAKAFSNQKQYWKDFNTLFNSEYLIQRRDGLKININEAEIAEMAKTSKNKAKAAISYLLNKGFVLTRHADSFAIASGGAAFYRNRTNKYIKEGKSKVEAEKQAFIDFKEISETSQQSSRTDKISQQQASGLGRVVLAFANTPMQYARLQKRAIQDLINNRGDAKTNLSKITYYGFVQNLIFNALQQAMFAIGFDEDPNNQKQIMDKSGRLLNGMLDSQLRGLGYGGAAVATVKNMLFKISEEHSKGNPKYENAAWEALDFSPPISSKVTKVRSALRSIDYDLDDMKSKGFSLDNPAYMAGGQILSAAANIPVDRVIRKMDNIKDAMDEDVEMWAKAALLAGWSKWELGLQDNKPATWGDNTSFKDVKFNEMKFKPIKFKD